MAFTAVFARLLLVIAVALVLGAALISCAVVDPPAVDALPFGHTTVERI